MEFDRPLFASKLLRYREQFELDHYALASGTGIEVPRLVDLEGAASDPSGDEVLILADFFKCDFTFFITGETVAPFEQTETLFRKHGTHLNRQDRWAIQEFLYLCETEHFLQTILNRPRPKPFKFVKRGTLYKAHGRSAASELRGHLGILPHIAIGDIYDRLRCIGLHVFRRRLDNSTISGLSILHPIAGKCVLVNYDEDVFRQRFTVAHEAGHAVLDDDQDFVVSFSKYSKDDLSEIRANAFASGFLLPRELLNLLPSPSAWTRSATVDWAVKLQVSTQALGYALLDAKLIDAGAAREIAGVAIPRERKEDPELPRSLSAKARERRQSYLQQGLSNHYIELCLDALRSGAITRGRAAEALLVHPTQLDGFLDSIEQRVPHEH